MDSLRDCPELHLALYNLDRQHIYLPGPETADGPTRWMPCSECSSVVFAIRATNPDGSTTVAAMCEDCAAPCPYGSIAIRRLGSGGPCEPPEESDDA